MAARRALDVVPLCNMDVAASRSRLGLRGSLDIAGLLAAGPDGTLLPRGLLIVTTRRLGVALIDALRFALIVSASLRALPLCHLGPLRYESFSDIVTPACKTAPIPNLHTSAAPGSDAAPRRLNGKTACPNPRFLGCPQIAPEGGGEDALGRRPRPSEGQGGVP